LTDEQLDELYDEFGEIPDHLVPVEPSIETVYTIFLWKKVKDQIMLSPMGHPYALDKSNVWDLLDKYGVEDISWQMEKIEIIFQEIYTKEKNE
jgi:hypothetical protein